MAFGNEIKSSNITENWLFDFQNNNSGFLRLSFQDTVDSSNFYHGVILNRPTIRHSINLASSTAQSSNISIDIPDFKYGANPVSRELFGGSNSYINHTVSVYIKVGSGTKQQVGSFRLTDISSNGNKVKLSMVTKRPWDFISFPQTKSDSNIYQPSVYGDYTANSTNAFQTSQDLFPLPFAGTSGDNINYIAPKSYGSGAKPHFYDKNNDIFIIMGDESDSTVSFESVNVNSVGFTLKRGTFYIRPARVFENNEFTNPENSFDTDLSTFANSSSLTASISGAGANSNRQSLRLNFPMIDGRLTEFKLHIKGEVNCTTSSTGVNNAVSKCSIIENTYTPQTVVSTTSSGTASTSGHGASSAYEEVDLLEKYENSEDSGSDLDGAITSLTATTIGVDNDSHFKLGDIIKINNEKMLVTAIDATNDVLTVMRGFYNTTATTHADNADIHIIPDARSPEFINIEYVSEVTVLVSGNGTTVGSGKIYDVYAVLKVESDKVREPTATTDIANKTNYLYSGADGLTHGITGLSGAIDEIHDAHLDLLNRFTGLDVDTNPNTNIDGWSELDSSKDWKIRYWQLEPTDLKEQLEKLQYEGGFIFRFKADGTPQYIHIADSVSSSATLTKNDISNVVVKPSPFSELLTKMNINYRKHPSEKRYLKSKTAFAHTARSKYNINSKENIQEVDLDAYVSPDITEYNSSTLVENSNPNNDFFAYYFNIFGDVKLIVSFDVVNPSFYSLEVGDIISFSDMYPDTPFGHNSASWSGLNFMITSLQRSLGKLKIEVREI